MYPSATSAEPRLLASDDTKEKVSGSLEAAAAAAGEAIQFGASPCASIWNLSASHAIMSSPEETERQRSGEKMNLQQPAGSKRQLIRSVCVCLCVVAGSVWVCGCKCHPDDVGREVEEGEERRTIGQTEDGRQGV